MCFYYFLLTFIYRGKLPDSSFCRTALLGFAILLRCYYVQGKEPKQLGKQLLSNYNPHRSWLGLTEQQKFTFGEASLVRSEGVLSFCNGCEGSNIQCNGRQSLRLDGRKVCSIKRVDISQAESNKIKACALPSIHLPLTREASVAVLFEG